MAERFFKIMLLGALYASLECLEEAGESISEENRQIRSELSENAHGTLSDDEYVAKYRVSKRVFTYILNRIKNKLCHRHNKVSPYIQLAIFLNHCANGTTVRVLMIDHGLTKRQCVHILRKVSYALIQLDKVRWPTLEAQKTNAREFNTYQPLFDGAIGAIDGTHVQVNENQDTKQYYINRKNWPSVSIMAVCDANLRFMYIAHNAPGRVHDARVFNMSKLPDILNNPLLTAPYYYLLGDAAYGNRARVLAPSPTVSTVGENRSYTHLLSLVFFGPPACTYTHCHTLLQVQLRPE